MRTIDFVGWVVFISDPSRPRDQRFARCRNQAEARNLARRLNAQSVREHGTRGPLFWAEFIPSNWVAS